MIKEQASCHLATLDFIAKKSIEAYTLSQKIEILERSEKFRTDFKSDSKLGLIYQKETPENKVIIASIFAIGEGPIVFRTVEDASYNKEKFERLLSILWETESFYKEIGGIVGYHCAVMNLLHNAEPQAQSDTEFLKPTGYDLTQPDIELNHYVRWGIEGLSQMAEIYPVGGAGDRLNLKNEETGEPYPAAELLFCGHTLLNTLIRDLQAKEYLYFKLLDEQILTPIAMMTSEEKENHRRIIDICARNDWFGRPQESFMFFSQPLVPVINVDGHWSMTGPLELTLKPGGHGVIWKLALENGVLAWLEQQKRTKALLRQINNPVAGTDLGVLAFCGIGVKKKKNFGFASCPRLLHTAQGTVVLVRRKTEKGYEYTTSNIEYTDFTKKGLEDSPGEPGSEFSKFPANTNILFADLGTIEKAIPRCPVPGMLVNFKNNAPFIDQNGRVSEAKAGRLETTMQNISDCITEQADHSLTEKELLELKTYVTYYDRRKTISVTKNSFDPTKPLLETPPGCFYELLQNNISLFADDCGFQIPTLCDEKTYVKQGPNIILLYHPALGPVYSIIKQKIRGGRIHQGSELQLEIAEVDIDGLDLNGTLLIHAENLLGRHKKDSYSEFSGKCELKNVKVQNKGINRNEDNVYWKNKIERTEKLHIILKGNSEFIAENITFTGNQVIEVPDGYRWRAVQKGNKIEFQKEKIQSPTWYWKYAFQKDDSILLTKE